MLKVLLVMTARNASAPELYVEPLIRALAGECRFTVALADHPDMQRIRTRLEQVVRVVALPFARSTSAPRVVPLLQHMAAAHDVIHLVSNHPASRWGIALAGALGGRGTPLVCVEHRATPVDDVVVPRALVGILPLLFRWSRRRAARVVAVSHASKQVLTDYYRLPAATVDVVHNGVDLDRFGTPPAALTLRHELRLTATQPLILVLARLQPNKGHRFLIEAAPAILARFPGAHFALAGDPAGRAPIEQQIAALGLEQHFSLLGFRSDVVNLLYSCDLFVLPSLAEGFARSIIEALAAGVPVVATRVGGAAEIVHEGVNGFLVPPADAAALAQGVQRVLALDHSARERMRQAARTSAQPFSLNQMANGMLAVYQAIQFNPSM